MVSTRRKILFFIFIAIFIIATPLIALYATGYKINLKNPLSRQLVQKTGMFILETKPEGASIYIDDKEQKNILDQLFFKKTNTIKTPAKIKGLLPEEYDVRLELSGYWTWNKKLFIHSGQITAQEIRLFKKDLPMQIISAPPQKIIMSEDKKKIFLPKEGSILDLKSENQITAVKTDEEENILWSKDNRRVLAGNIIFDIRFPEKNIYLYKEIGHNLKNIKWGRETNKIYYQNKNSLNSFNLTSKINESLINLVREETFLDYLIKDDYIYFVSKNGIKVNLRAYSLSDKKIIKEIELPISDGYKLINPDHNLINLYDEQYKILYLINYFSVAGPLEEIISNIKYSVWTSEKTLLWANDFEIWKFDIEEGKKQLLTRISQPIISIIETRDRENYIIYSTKESINVLECLEQEKIQVTELIKLDEISAPEINDNGNVLYFHAKIGNQEGLYKLNI